VICVELTLQPVFEMKRMEVHGFVVGRNDPSRFIASPFGYVGGPVVHPTWEDIQAALAPRKIIGSPSSVDSALLKTPPSITTPWTWRGINPKLKFTYPPADKEQANKKVKPPPTPAELASRVLPCPKCGYKWFHLIKSRPGPIAAEQGWPHTFHPGHPCTFPPYVPRDRYAPEGQGSDEDE
jgi:hypothetical protein